jgi:hypothetical protein
MPSTYRRGPYLDSNDTIIFIDEHTDETMVATNQTSTGLGVSIGTVYKYEKAIDFIRGGLTSVYTGSLYNQRLLPGHFYYVEDGYVVGEAPVSGYGSPVGPGDPGPWNRNDIQIVEVSWLDRYFAAYRNDYVGTFPSMNPYTTTFGTIIVYELKGTTVTYKADGSDLLDIAADFAKIVNKPNTYANAYVYTGDAYSGQKRVFITTTYTTGDDLAVEKNLGNVLDYGPCNNHGNCYKYEITAEQYAALSDWLRRNNDIWNDEFSHIGTTMQLYNGNKIVPQFTNDNISIVTEYGGDGTLSRYYLHIGLEPGSTTELPYYYDEDDPTPLWLVWTNPDNTNHSYKMNLKQLVLARPFVQDGE